MDGFDRVSLLLIWRDVCVGLLIFSSFAVSTAFFPEIHDNVIDVTICCWCYWIWWRAEELKFFFSRQSTKKKTKNAQYIERAIAVFASAFCTMCIHNGQCVFFVMQDLSCEKYALCLCLFYTHVHTSHIFIWILAAFFLFRCRRHFCFFYPGFFPRSILLFNELNTHQMKHEKKHSELFVVYLFLLCILIRVENFIVVSNFVFGRFFSPVCIHFIFCSVLSCTLVV